MREGQGPLELREEPGGLRHYLAGEAIHAGEILELLLPDGAWLEGRYEWDFRQDVRPLFFTALGGDWERDPARYEPLQAPMRIPELATLRWPKRDAFGKRL
jgi:hypothetical protein